MILFAENTWLAMGRSQFKTKANGLQVRSKLNLIENQLVNSPYSVNTLSGRRVIKVKEIINELDENPGRLFEFGLKTMNNYRFKSTCDKGCS